MPTVLLIGGHLHGDVLEVPASSYACGELWSHPPVAVPWTPAPELVGSVPAIVRYRRRRFGYRAQGAPAAGWTRDVWALSTLSADEVQEMLAVLLLGRWIRGEVGPELGPPTLRHDVGDQPPNA